MTSSQPGSYPPGTVWTCPACRVASPAVTWAAVEVRCDDCGSHPGHECPRCGERFDDTRTELEETRPGEGAMDHIGWHIATTHQLLGHDKAAAALGVPPGDKTACLICAFEAYPTEENKRAVIDAIGGSR